MLFLKKIKPYNQHKLRSQTIPLTLGLSQLFKMRIRGSQYFDMKPLSQNFTTNLIRTGMRYGRCSILTTAFSSEILKWTISSLKLLSSSSLSKFSLGVINIVCGQVGAVKIDTHTYTHTQNYLPTFLSML